MNNSTVRGGGEKRVLSNNIREQKNLWEVYKCQKELGDSKFNKITFWAVILLLALLLFLGFLFTEESTNASFDFLKNISRVSFSYAVAIVGLLVAGLAILISSDSDNLFLALASTLRKKSTITEFQFIFFNFLISIIYHLYLLATSIIAVLLLEDGYFLIEALSKFFRLTPTWAYIINSVLILGFAVLFARCILTLKSFIWNLYQSVILTVLWQDHKVQKNKEKEKGIQSDYSELLSELRKISANIEKHKG